MHANHSSLTHSAASCSIYIGSHQLEIWRPVQVSAIRMASLVEDMERLKAQGASVQDRELRLQQGSQELQNLLSTVKQETKSA